MCRTIEGIGHEGVALRKGCYADRLEDGSVALCVHSHGDIHLAAIEITLSPAELALVGLLAVVAEEPPITASVTVAQNAVVPVIVTTDIPAFEPDEVPEANIPKPPVRTKPAVQKAAKPAGTKKVKH